MDSDWRQAYVKEVLKFRKAAWIMLGVCHKSWPTPNPARRTPPILYMYVQIQVMDEYASMPKRCRDGGFRWTRGAFDARACA